MVITSMYVQVLRPHAPDISGLQVIGNSLEDALWWSLQNPVSMTDVESYLQHTNPQLLAQYQVSDNVIAATTHLRVSCVVQLQAGLVKLSQTQHQHITWLTLIAMGRVAC